jgi:hypothetical protein
VQSDSAPGQFANSDWAAFIAKLEAAEHDFAQGRPTAFDGRGCPTPVHAPCAPPTDDPGWLHLNTS